MSNITNWQNSRNESFLIIRVRKDGYQFTIHGGSLLYHTDTNTEIDPLPEGKYALILDLDNATEEQAMQVSNSIAGRYIDHDKSDLVKSAYTSSSKESLHSLARSLKLDTENYNYVILKVNQ